ncbi:hypothetical protein [Rubrimonas cliftonensis]|nr:hypothetical protein [Rubrimonas cliftonensis]
MTRPCRATPCLFVLDARRAQTRAETRALKRAAEPRGRSAATSVTLDVDIETLWRAIQTPALLESVTRGLMRFDPVDPDGFPTVWDAREHRVDLRLFGWLPIGRQVIAIERPPAEGARRLLRDNGRGDVVSAWDHLMILEPAPGGRTRYTDLVRVEAGRLTLPVTALAWLYYALRQRNLRRLARSGAIA